MCCLASENTCSPQEWSRSSQSILWGSLSVLFTLYHLPGTCWSQGLPVFLVLWVVFTLLCSVLQKLHPCPRPNGRWIEKIEAIGTCPHLLDTTDPLTEETVLLLQNFWYFIESWLLLLPGNSFPSFLNLNERDSPGVLSVPMSTSQLFQTWPIDARKKK